MSLGWLRGPSRSLGVYLDADVDLAFDGKVGHTSIPDARHRRRIIGHGTIVHERTHWLNLVATNCGVFLIVVWEAQAHAAKQIITELGACLEVNSLPLCSLAERAERGTLTPRLINLLAAWNGLLNLQHWFFGNVRTLAVRPPTLQAIELLSSFLRLWLIERHPGPDATRHAASKRYELPDTFGQVTGVSGEGSALGWYELTECSARLSEHAVMLYGVEQASEQLVMDHGRLFEGVYGRARKQFYESTGRELTHTSEAILAVLVQESLNSSLPPLSPMSVFAEPWINLNPYSRLINLAKLTASYKPAQLSSVGVDGFARIRADIREILLERGLTVPDEQLCNHAQRIFGASAGFRLPKDLYEDNGTACSQLGNCDRL